MSQDNTTDSNKYHGKPCVRCGSTLRYIKKKRCVSCHKEDAHLRYLANPQKMVDNVRQWKKENPEKERAHSRHYRETHTEQTQIAGMEWRRKNRERKRLTDAAWAKQNPEKRRESIRRYQQANPHILINNNRKRRARKSKVKSEPYDFEAICNHYGNKCLKCGRNDVKLTVDHIKPISLGGPDIASNIQPLCKPCNSSKHARDIDYRPNAGPLRWIQKKLFG